MSIADYGFAIWETFYVTVLSTAFALVLGLPLGVLLVAGDKDGVLPLPGWLMHTLNIILTILLFLSGVLTVILVLMHSGKGTGVSDMIASSLYNAGTGSGILEKNLDRLTVITATVFIVCVIVMALTFPLGAIG